MAGAGDNDSEAARELFATREELRCAREDAAEARRERDHVLGQARDANEKLLIATLRADEMAEEALAAEATTAAHAVTLMAQDRAKDEFLAMLGHELRNPLSPIVTILDGIRVRAPELLANERAIIEGQVKQLVRIVDDLLDIARVNEGKIELRVEAVDLAEVVARAVDSVSPLVATKQQKLEVAVGDDLIVAGDFVRLAQVIGNLLSNAAKYTPEHGSVRVSADRRGTTISVRVRDSGIGISKDMLPRVFELFAQEGRDRSERGLGLGLTIARRIVEMHGGEITARSDGVGQGAELEVVLHATSERPSEPAVKVRPSGEPLGIKVLLVDDNSLACEAMELLVTMLGYEVRTATNSASALALARDFRPEIAILDIGMPGMNGYQLAAALRTQVAPRVIRFISLSGYGQASDRRRSEQEGFDEHLVKPVDIDTIQASLCRTVLRLPAP